MPLILTVIQGPDKGRRFEVPDNEPQLIGRSSAALHLTDHTISRRHAEMTPDDGRWYINDLNSANGTYVNGIRVANRRLLQAGDQVRTGNTLLLFGIEAQQLPIHGSAMSKDLKIDAHVESVFASNEDSIIMAVPEPTQAAVVQLKVIYQLTQLIALFTDRDELLDRVMDLIFEYFQADRGFILLQSDPDERLNPVIVRHRIPPENKEQRRVSVSHTIVHHVLSQGEGVLSTNAMADHRFATGDSVQHYGIRSALCVPVKFKDTIFGVIHLDSQIINYTFTEDQLRLLTAIGVHTGLALANAQMYAEQLKRERLAAVGQTVASLSHSIRNILQGMRGGADVVELGLRKNSMHVLRNGWGIVARNLDRIYELTMNMLSFSKQRKPELEMTNLNNLINDVVQLVQQQYDDKSAALITDLDQDMPPVPIGPIEIHQAILNLLNNALDAVKPQTGVVSLATKYDVQTHHVNIRISDNGVGMDSMHLKELFEPFRSTKGQRGTGLGLVVTQKVVDDHSGTIDVDSSPQQGTTFRLSLPTHRGQLPTLADTAGA